MSSKWVIKDADGNITNPCIKGTEEFVAANFDYYEAYVAPSVPALTDAEEARMWRDMELFATDTASQTPDWPNRDNILIYRAALRNWPSTSDFPDTKPTLGS
jgi:hypothetical protein|tara:strand:+ start:851 stop:1156 length:306 start_codon:yes stop_codon:yes gene_type:complete